MGASEEARHLLMAAQRDFRALQGMLDADIFVDEIFGFHAQQAAEKTLKAWLALLDVQYPKSHDLSLLLTLLETNGQDVTPHQDLVDLNPYAVQYRYEAFEDSGPALDRLAFIERVRAVIESVDSLI